MITSLISGKLITDPKSGSSSRGNEWCRATVACPIHSQKEGEPDSVVVSLIAFGDEAMKMAKLSKGDAIAAVGSTKISQWERNGEIRIGLDLLANEVLTPYRIKQKRNHKESEPQHGPEARQAANAFYGRSNSGYDDDLSDPLTF